MARTKQWSDDIWPRAQLIFPGQDCGPIVAMLKGLAKRHDQSCVLEMLNRLSGQKFDASKMWAVCTKVCADVVRDRANALGSTGRAPAAVSEQFRDR